MIDINTLRQVPLFAELSDEQLQWLAEQGTEVWLEPEIHRAQGDPADHVCGCSSVRFVMEKVGDQELLIHTGRKQHFWRVANFDGYDRIQVRAP